MKQATSRKALQTVIAVSAAAPLLSGLVGLSGIYNPLFLQKLPDNTLLDTNLRFLNAMSVAVGLAFYFIIPVIEKETFACRALCATIIFGGIGRLISIFNLGKPPGIVLVFMAVELSVPVLIIFWQKRLARQQT